ERSVSDLVDLSDSKEQAPIVGEVQKTPKATPAARKMASPGREITQFEEFAKHCRTVAWKIDPMASVFSTQLEHQTGAEKFRTLRSRLYQIASAQPLRKILITSSTPAEGKTFVAANLAQSFIRQTNRRVLLIDSDLRASRLHL